MGENLGVNYIIEEGTSGIWHWKKWKNGEVWLYGVWQGTIAPYTSNMLPPNCPNGYMNNWDLPVALKYPYFKCATAQVGTGVTLIASGGLNDTTSSVGFHWASSSKGASRVNMFIIGTISE